MLSPFKSEWLLNPVMSRKNISSSRARRVLGNFLVHPISFQENPCFLNKAFNLFVFSLLFSLCAGNSFAAGNSEDNIKKINELFGRMSEAVRAKNYKGFFTFEVGGSLDTYKIVHRIDNDIETERLQKLNGKEREIIRSGHSPECLSQGDRLLRGLPVTLGETRKLLLSYRVYLASDERVANRMAYVIHVIPVDRHRYGYTYAVDKLTNLPLKIMLIGENKKVLERFQFVELEVGDNVTEEDVLPRSKNVRSAKNQLINCDQNNGESSEWVARWIPSGFVYSGQRTTQNGDDVLMFTDGLASFSVFISPQAGLAMQGRAQTGATVAYVEHRVWDQRPFSIFVVGQIPLATSRQVAANLEKRSPSSVPIP